MRYAVHRQCSCYADSLTARPLRTCIPGPSRHLLPASGAAAALRLLGGWRAPCTAARANWMALEAAAARDVLSASRAPSSAAPSAPAGCAQTNQTARVASCRVAASSCAAAAATEAATAPRSDAASGTGRSMDAEATGPATRGHGAGSTGQLPSSQSPALQFEVSFGRQLPELAAMARQLGAASAAVPFE